MWVSASWARAALRTRGYATASSRKPPPAKTPRAAGPSSVPVHKKDVRPPPPPPPQPQSARPAAAPGNTADGAGGGRLGGSKSLLQSYQSLSYGTKLRVCFGFIAFSAAGLMVADRLEGRFPPEDEPAAAPENGAKYIDHKPAPSSPRLFGITVVDRK